MPTFLPPSLLAAAGSSPLYGLGVALGILLCIVCVLAFFYFVAAPVIVLLVHRQSVAPEILPHDPGPFPTPADEFYNELGPRLADLGFGETQRWSVRGFVSNLAAELCTMADRRRRVLAIANVMHVRQKGVFRLHSRFIEFVSRFEDGRSLSTTNSLTPLLFADLGPRRIVQLPSLRDPEALLRAHEQLVAGERPASPVKEPPAREEVPARIQEAITASHEWQVARGLLTPPSSGRHRLTLKGAYLFTLTALPPGKQMLKRRRAAQEAAVLKELGQ